MPETEPTRPDVPQLHDKRFKIPGLVPRNAQHKLLGLIAMFMVVIIALSGRNPPKDHPTSRPAVVEKLVDPNQPRIKEYRKRIEEEAQKLAAEEAQVSQTKQALLTGNPQALGGTATTIVRRGWMGGAANRPYWPEEARSTLEQDREKREAQSLFASNIALTYRQAAAATREQMASRSGRLATTSISETEASQFLRSEATSALDQTSGRAMVVAGNQKTLQLAEGKSYRLFEGTVIETVLTNRLDSSFSGPINCLVTTHVYSHDGQHLLIPQGSRVLGEVRKLESMGDQRLTVTFHRLIMPDGYSVSLDKFQGLNQIGETGLRDQVNHHYLQIFGVSLAVGAIAGLSQANTRYGLDTSATDAYRQGVTTSVSQSSLHILDRYLNVLPTFRVREGHRVKIYLSQDLMLPAYEAHQMASDL
jgi:type IV secretion system protein VirB10